LFNPESEITRTSLARRYRSKKRICGVTSNRRPHTETDVNEPLFTLTPNSAVGGSSRLRASCSADV
jgi:hypothetical protein